MAKTTGALKGFRARSQSFSTAGLAAILSLNFGERELAAMTHRVISPVDRAERFRIAGETRVDVGLMGFLKINRGGLGISPSHAHEICESHVGSPRTFLSQGPKLGTHKILIICHRSSRVGG